MTPVMPRPVSIIRGKLRTGSLVSSAMFTASSKPTIAKKAIDVAAVIGEEDVLLARGVEHRHLREVGLAAGGGVDADEDDEQQAGELDEGQHHVGLDALADPAEVDRRDEQHEGQRDAEHEGLVLAVEPEPVGEVGGEGVATPSRPR